MEDEKFIRKKTLDTLVAAGYFRARIDGLSEFDKIAGGMVWAITASAFAVDVDIIFEENSSIGERIKTGEGIVRALIQMKCPHRIQPHQIHSRIDYPFVFPVIQWLVKSVLEYRDIIGDTIRRFSVSQFQKNYDRFPEEKQTEQATVFVGQVTSRYKPRRKFKKSETSVYQTKGEEVDATLLEYGEKFYREGLDESEFDEDDEEEKHSHQSSNRVVVPDFLKGKISKKKTKKELKAEAEKAMQKQINEEKARLEGLQQGLEVASGETDMKELFVESTQISREEKDYEDRQKEVETVGRTGGKSTAEQTHKRKMENFTRRLEELTAKRDDISGNYAEAIAKLQESQATARKQIAFKKRLLLAIAEIEKLEGAAENKAILEKLKKLVQANEHLKSQESAFKGNCKNQLTEFTLMIKKIESEEPDEETNRLQQIENLHKTDKAKQQKLKQILAKTNQEIAKIVRKIDDIPTRAELLQYERRFVELYELVAEKLKETKKYYALYNTLDSTHTYMSKEVSLFKSIQEGFNSSMKTSSARKQFLASFKNIVDGVTQSCEKVARDLGQTRIDVDTHNDRMQKLVERQRRYYKAVKDFQEECFKNEQLEERIEKVRRKYQGE